MTKSIKKNVSRPLWLLISFILLCSLIACGGSKDDATDTGSNTTGTNTTETVVSIDLSASNTSIPSDGSSDVIITVNALNSAHAALGNVVVTMGTDSGHVGAPNVTTPGTITFNTGGNKINRTATITATSGSITALLPIQILGSYVELSSSATGLPIGTNATLTVTPKDSAGHTVSGANVALSQSPAGRVTFVTAASGTTDNNGKFYATVQGATNGTSTITATALGATATTDLTVSTVADAFAIDGQMINSVPIANDTTTAMKINTETLNISVHAPTGVAHVTFATTIGQWNGGGTKIVTVAASGNEASANLTTAQTGVANIQVFDTANPATKDTLTVAMSSGAAPYSITLQAAPANVSKSVGTTTGSSTLLATVYDSGSNPIGGVPVAFSIVDGTGTSGGETILPVIATTASETTTSLGLGQAVATFTSGSMTSTGDGIHVRATVAGTTVATGAAPSGVDAKIIIGGVPCSIAFGQATVISTLNAGTYSYPMSILVADSAGAAVKGAVVSLSVFPIAWSTGTTLACAYDADNGTNKGTFWTEDINENFSLDTGEDGKRTYYTASSPPDASGPATTDNVLTPENAAGGTVPSTVTTDVNGVATFNLNYPKQSAIWTVVRLRGTTTVSQTETRAEIIFRLPALQSDVSPCLLTCPYKF
jgi:hypothetical protein